MCCQSTVKHQLSAEEAKVQAAELVRKARIKREREEAELARTREREVRGQGQRLHCVCMGTLAKDDGVAGQWGASSGK
jgi:hypothetical protein